MDVIHGLDIAINNDKTLKLDVTGDIVFINTSLFAFKNHIEKNSLKLLELKSNDDIKFYINVKAKEFNVNTSDYDIEINNSNIVVNIEVKDA